MITTTTPLEVIVGVDTHKDVHAAIAISTLGVQLSATTIPASSKGYKALEIWAASLGTIRAIGIEGTGSYGAGLTRTLLLTYNPALYTAGAACLVAAVAVMAIRGIGKPARPPMKTAAAAS